MALVTPGNSNVCVLSGKAKGFAVLPDGGIIEVFDDSSFVKVALPSRVEFTNNTGGCPVARMSVEYKELPVIRVYQPAPTEEMLYLERLKMHKQSDTERKLKPNIKKETRVKRKFNLDES